MMASESSIAMGGGGGEWGLFVDEDFSRGSSGRSETFGNAPLCDPSDFEILNFECWGFTTATHSRRRLDGSIFPSKFERG